jgi:hypothetical protein
MQGYKNRCIEDEKMLRDIGSTNPLDSDIKVLDARSYISASANRLKQGGYENEEYYTNCKVIFGGIDNIHKVRDAFNKVYACCIQSK